MNKLIVTRTILEFLERYSIWISASGGMIAAGMTWTDVPTTQLLCLVLGFTLLISAGAGAGVRVYKSLLVDENAKEVDSQRCKCQICDGQVPTMEERTK